MSDRVPTAAEGALLAAMDALIGAGSPHGGGRAYEEHEVMRACEAEGWASYCGGWHITDTGREALARCEATRQSIATRAAAWWASRDTGVSSEAIARHMQGLRKDCTWAPLDLYDFGRCVRLLDRIPEWKERLGEMSTFGPAWAEIVGAWDVLLPIYRECAKHVDWNGCQEHYDAWAAAMIAYRAAHPEARP